MNVVILVFVLSCKYFFFFFAGYLFSKATLLFLFLFACTYEKVTLQHTIDYEKRGKLGWCVLRATFGRLYKYAIIGI